MSLLSTTAMSMLLPVPDDDHCVVCPTCETLGADAEVRDLLASNISRAVSLKSSSFPATASKEIPRRASMAHATSELKIEDFQE